MSTFEFLPLSRKNKTAINAMESEQVSLPGQIEVIFRLTVTGQALDHRPPSEPVSSSEFHEVVRTRITETLQRDLPRDLRELYGIDIHVRILTVRMGSIMLIFNAIIGAAGVIANYKDLAESVELIKEHAYYLVASMFRQDFRGEQLIPQISSGYVRSTGVPASSPGSLAPPVLRRSNRDAFFWFLLAFCVVQAAIIVALVYEAVDHTYFQH